MSYAILAALDKRSIHLLHVDYGQKAAKGELKALKAVTEKYKCLKAHTIEAPLIALASNSALLKGKSGNDYFVESRNLGLALIASKFSGNIMFCFSQDSTVQEYPDTSRHWCDLVSKTLTLGAKRPIMVYSPIAEHDRLDVVLEAAKINPTLVKKSHTCYQSVECGNCFRCKWKQEVVKGIDRAKLKG